MTTKRIYISIFLTFIMLVATNKLFFAFNPIYLSFNPLNIPPKTTISVLYAKKTKNVFKNINSVKYETVSADKTEKILLPVYRVGKVRIEVFNNNEKANLNDITFGNTNYYKKIPSDSIKNNIVGDIHTIYIEDIDVWATPLINGKIFFILATVFFLFSLRMVRYLIDFKIKQNYSRIDIVFLACFFVVLFIPASYVSDAETDIKENRMLQKYVPLFKDGKINNDFGKNFETYFNDRFFGRHFLLKQYDNLKATISPHSGNGRVAIGKNDFLFYRADNGIKNFQNNVMYSKEFLDQITTYLKEINEFCKKNGKQFVFFIAPDKHRVYGENMKYVKKFRPDSESKTMQLINYLREHTDITVIYPLEELLEEKNKHPDDLLYWKYDTHWSEKGAYIGYTKLMKKLDIPTVSIKGWIPYEKNDGDLSKMYSAYKTTSSLYKKPDIINQTTCKKNLSQEKMSYCNDGRISSKRAIFFHDSFIGAMYPYLSTTLKETYYYWRPPIISIDKDAIKEHVDIVVWECLERLIPTHSYKTKP